MVERLLQDSPLGFDLKGVIDVLPLTATAGSEVRTRRVDASRPRPQNSGDPRTDESFFLFGGTYLDMIARQSKGDEDDFAPVTPKALATVDQLLDGHLERLGSCS
jgi:hypothetical protein